MIFTDEHRQGSFLTIHQARIATSRDLRSLLASPHRPVFLKTLRAIGSGDGLGRLPGDPRLNITLAAWSSETAACNYLRSATGRHRGRDWSALLSVVSTRGSYRGATPLTGAESTGEGAFCALTLGRTGLPRLARFIRHGTRLSSVVHAAPGLLFAASAGWPITGNCTFTAWSSRAAMLDFAYRSPEGHSMASSARKPILLEQLNARLTLLDSSGIPGVSPRAAAPRRC